MTGLFSTPSISTPKVLPPPAIPAGPDPEDAARRLRGRKGFTKTILTGQLTPTTGKKTLLG